MSVDQEPAGIDQSTIDEAKARIADSFKKSMESAIAAEGMRRGFVRAGFDRVDHVVEAERVRPSADEGLLSQWGLGDESLFEAFAQRLAELKKPLQQD
jgi:hypothetical protein